MSQICYMSGTHGASGVVFYSMITLYAGSVHTETEPHPCYQYILFTLVLSQYVLIGQVPAQTEGTDPADVDSVPTDPAPVY